VDTYNLIRERAGLAPHTLGDEVTTQADVLAETDLQRRSSWRSRATGGRTWFAPAGR
jgi:hypothetical protein